jgi:hypothetical protein
VHRQLPDGARPVGGFPLRGGSLASCLLALVLAGCAGDDDAADAMAANPQALTDASLRRDAAQTAALDAAADADAARGADAGPVPQPDASGVWADAGAADASTADDGGANGLDRASLIDHSAWTELPSDADPFWDADAGYRRCVLGDYVIEGTVSPYLEVNTTACNYVTLTQAARLDLQPGDEVALALSHQDLLGDGAIGFAAVQVGDDEVWSKTVPVTAVAQSHNLTHPVSTSLPKGTPVLFHVHNHGANAWRLLSLERLRPAAP